VPTFEISHNELKFELSGAEKVWALSRGLRISLDIVTSAHIEEDVRKDIGWRCAGTRAEANALVARISPS
jgi:hypothetical protein